MIEPAAAKALRKMQPKRAAALLSRLEAICANPFAGHANVTALKGAKDAFRLRQGDWRAVYVLSRRSDTMHVIDIAPRGEIYK